MVDRFIQDVFGLFQATLVGVAVLLPLANPLTAVAYMLSVSNTMTKQIQNQVSWLAGVYSFGIMMVAFYLGEFVMNTFGISIPGLRIAGGLIVSYIGFYMLFPKPAIAQAIPEAIDPLNIAFVPLAMPGIAGPGTIALIISTTSTVRSAVDEPVWIVHLAAIISFLLISVLAWVSLRSSRTIMRIVGKSGIDATARIMGFLLVCMGIQFVINGVVEIVKKF